MKTKLFFMLGLIALFAFTFSISAQSVDRTKPPQLPALKQLSLPAIQEFNLSNGLKVVLMEKHDVPLVQLNLTVNAGSVNDPENKFGLFSLLGDMLDEGAAGKTSMQIADEIDFLGASIRTYAGMHETSINLHTALSKFDDALKIMADIALRPDFPQKEIDKKKKDRLTNLMQAHDQPTAIASTAFNKFLFTEAHPYGRLSVGNEASIKSFSSEDFKTVYKKFFVSNNAYIIAVGDIKKEELTNKLEAAFGKWQKGNVAEAKVKEAAQVSKRVVYIIDKPGAPQSVINIGRIGAARTSADYNALTVMNTILGGSFTSRLNNNLREEHGYTYGAGSNFSFRPIPGSFTASSSVQTEVTDKALIEFFKELNGIRELIPSDEFARGKNLVALGYPQEFTSIESIAGSLDEMISYNLPRTYFNDFIGNIQKLTAADINKAAKKYIVPEEMIVVVVGDRAKIEEGIKKLNLGEIKNLSIVDVLGNLPKLD